MIVTQHVDFLAAFLAGISTFFTPCTLPLIPAWLALATGRDYKDLTTDAKNFTLALRIHLFGSTIAFILGFSLIFVSLGAMASALGEFLFIHEELLRYLGGTIMIVFGLVLLGVISPAFLNREKRFNITGKPAGFLGAFLVGMAFAAGWTPCVGPVLGAVLSLAATRESLSRGIELLAVFSLGLGVPFLVIAILWGKILPRLVKLGRYTVWINRVMGVLIIILAVLVISNKLTIIVPH